MIYIVTTASNPTLDINAANLVSVHSGPRAADDAKVAAMGYTERSGKEVYVFSMSATLTGRTRREIAFVSA